MLPRYRRTFSRKNELGQASVEFVVVAAAFLVIVIAIGALGSAIADGISVDSATRNAPNSVESDAFEYVLMY